jgi:hypothetical protein
VPINLDILKDAMVKKLVHTYEGKEYLNVKVVQRKKASEIWRNPLLRSGSICAGEKNKRKGKNNIFFQTQKREVNSCNVPAQWTDDPKYQ